MDRTLRSAGYDSIVIEMDDGLASVLRPSTPTGDMALSIIAEVMQEREDLFSERATIEVRYDHSGCQVATTAGLRPGRPFDVHFTNRSDAEAWVLVIDVDPTAAVQPDIGSPSGQHFERHPGFLEQTTFRSAGPDAEALATLSLTRFDNWLVACVVPDADPTSFTLYPTWWLPTD